MSKAVKQNRVQMIIREKDFLQSVRELAELLGWKVYHTWNSLHSPAGFPDLVLVRPPRVIFAELKTGNRKLTSAQMEWMELLGKCPGVEWYRWTPDDWEEIGKILGARSSKVERPAHNRLSAGSNPAGPTTLLKTTSRKEVMNSDYCEDSEMLDTN